MNCPNKTLVRTQTKYKVPEGLNLHQLDNKKSGGGIKK